MEGVLLGYWYGNKLKDEDGYLKHGINKRVFYKIFRRVEDIDQKRDHKIAEGSYLCRFERSTLKTKKKAVSLTKRPHLSLFKMI